MTAWLIFAGTVLVVIVVLYVGLKLSSGPSTDEVDPFRIRWGGNNGRED